MRSKFRSVYDAIKAVADKQGRSIGALGARWDMGSGQAFRDALAGVLEKNFDV